MYIRKEKYSTNVHILPIRYVFSRVHKSHDDFILSVCILILSDSKLPKITDQVDREIRAEAITRHYLAQVSRARQKFTYTVRRECSLGFHELS